jgi:hypothetical protein
MLGSMFNKKKPIASWTQPKATIDQSQNTSKKQPSKRDLGIDGDRYKPKAAKRPVAMGDKVIAGAGAITRPAALPGGRKSYISG